MRRILRHFHLVVTFVASLFLVSLCKTATMQAQTLTFPILGSQPELTVATAQIVPGEAEPGPVVSLIVESPPLHGSLEPVANGFVYRPDESFWSLGSDSFTVDWETGEGDQGLATVRLVAAQHGAEIAVDRFESSLLSNQWAVNAPMGGVELLAAAALEGMQGLALHAPSGAGLEYPNCAILPEIEPCIGSQGGGEQGGGAVITLRPPPRRQPPAGETNETILYSAGPAEQTLFDLRMRLGSAGIYELAATALAEFGAGSLARAATAWIPLGEEAARSRLDGWLGVEGAGGLRLWLDDRVVASLGGLANGGGSLARQRVGSWPAGVGEALALDLDDVHLHRAGEAASEADFPRAEVLFADSFEDGTGAAWENGQGSSTVPQVTATSALSGRWGLEVGLESTSFLFKHFASERAMNARFRVDPRQMVLPQMAPMKLFAGTVTGGSARLELWMRLRAASLQLQAVAVDDSGERHLSPWRSVTLAPHAVELQWRAASGPESHNGLVRLWIDGVLVASLAGLDNDGQQLTGIQLGVLTRPAASAGVLFLDAVELWR